MARRRSRRRSAARRDVSRSLFGRLLAAASSVKVAWWWERLGPTRVLVTCATEGCGMRRGSSVPWGSPRPAAVLVTYSVCPMFGSDPVSCGQRRQVEVLAAEAGVESKVGMAARSGRSGVWGALAGLEAEERAKGVR